MTEDTVFHALVKSFVRKGMTYIAGLLMAGGWINADLSNRLTGEAVVMISASLVTFILSSYLSYKNVIWEFVKTQIAKIMPPNATMRDVVAVAETVKHKTAVAKGEVDIMESIPITAQNSIRMQINKGK